jgi:hypothetical protein
LACFRYSSALLMGVRLARCALSNQLPKVVTGPTPAVHGRVINCAARTTKMA